MSLLFFIIFLLLFYPTFSTTNLQGVNMSTYNHAAYLQAILNNPKTSTQDYLRAERELQSMQAHQTYLNQTAQQRQTYEG